MPIMAFRHLLYRWINSNVYRKSTDQLTTATVLVHLRTTVCARPPKRLRALSSATGNGLK
jgi:hypothetical protein